MSAFGVKQPAAASQNNDTAVVEKVVEEVKEEVKEERKEEMMGNEDRVIEEQKNTESLDDVQQEEDQEL